MEPSKIMQRVGDFWKGEESSNNQTPSIKQEEEEWETTTETKPPPPPPSTHSSPRQPPNPLTAFIESTTKNSNSNLNTKPVRIHELSIKVAPNESNANILTFVENTIINSPVLEGRSVHRESLRTVCEVGSVPITVSLVFSQNLDRCVLVRVPEPVPDQLFNILRDAFAQGPVQISPRGVPDSADGAEEEHEENIDGPSVMNLLDQEYVGILKKEMQDRALRDLTTFATPLERRARDDERRVKRLGDILHIKYTACGVPMPELEQSPQLSTFPLVKTESPSVLTLKLNPSPREVDGQLKMALRRELHADSLARQERKKKEVLARAETCERNRNHLVTVLSNSRAALEMDIPLMTKLGVNPPQVALCSVACLHNKRPGFIVVTSSLILFEARFFVLSFSSSNVKIQARNCRSVHKGNSTLADSLILRMDSGDEYTFYFPVVDETSEQLDQVFELIWQVLRMNRTA